MQYPVGALLLVILSANRPVFSADPIADFRRDLANNDKYPIRHAHSVDIEALQKALLTTQDQNAAMLQKLYDESYKALVRKTGPDAKAYDLIFENREFSPMQENMRGYSLFYTDIRRMAQMILTSVLPVAMSREMAYSASQIGGWIAFLAIAEPEAYACDSGEKYFTVCLSYGGLDVFQVELNRDVGKLSLARLAWYRRKANKQNAR